MALRLESFSRTSSFSYPKLPVPLLTELDEMETADAARAPAPAPLPAPPPSQSPGVGTGALKSSWENFLNGSLSFTPHELALYSQLGINPYVLELAKYLCVKLSIPARAGEDLATGVKNNLTVEDPHQNLTGIQKVTGKISSTEAGLNLLSVLGVLCVYFTDDSVSLILLELTKLLGLPRNLEPLAEEWRGLTVLASNLVGSERFGDVVHRFTELGLNGSSGSNVLCHASAEAIARVVVGMGEVRRGECTTPLMGFFGKDAGWTAAVAEWLFDFRIVLKGIDGNVLYSNCGEVDIQSDIRFHNPGVPLHRAPVVGVELAVRHEL